MTTELDNADILEAEQGDSIEAKLELSKKAAQAYHEGAPIMTDDAFDALSHELKELGVEVQEVGHGFEPSKDKAVTHKYRMLSLTKAYEKSEIESWFNNLPEGSKVLVQAKYDGAAIELVYAKGTGKLIGASTRGNGTVGEDVTATAFAMAEAGRIPAKINVNKDEEVHVYGEVVIGRLDFDNLQKVTSNYTNIRNSASGIMRRTNTEFAKYLTFFAYDASAVNGTDDIGSLSEHGFFVPADHFQFEAKTVNGVWDAIQELGKVRDDFDFLTDGAVIKINASREERTRIGAGSNAPRWALAFKYPNTYKETTIRGVSWGVGRTGQVTPTAQFDKVDLGSNVGDATMHNYAQFFNWQFAPGDVFKITRAGEVIPYIGEVVSRSGEEKFKAPTNCPNCDGELFLSETETHLYCPSLGACATDENIVYSLQTLGVKGVSHSLVRKLLTEGLITNFLDILNIAEFEEQISYLPGEGVTSARKAVEAIEVVWDYPLSSWIAAMGIRNISFGSASILEANYNSLGEISKIEDIGELVALEDFGPTKAHAVFSNRDLFAEWEMRLQLEHDFSPERYEVEVVESDFTGKGVIVTGSLPRAGRDEANAWLVEHGAIVKGSISKNVDLVILGENAGPAKLVKIEQLGIKTMSGEEFDQIMFGD